MGFFSFLGSAYKAVKKGISSAVGAVKKVIKKIPIGKVVGIGAGFLTGGTAIGIGALVGAVAGKLKEIAAKHADVGAEQTEQAVYELQQEFPEQAAAIQREALKAGLVNATSGISGFFSNPMNVLMVAGVGLLMLTMLNRRR